jgi:hypothetical protein
VPTDAAPLALDLADFDAVGILGEVVVALRVHSIEADVDAAATISAPDGWHRVVVTARSSGHVVVGVRYTELSTSRWHNVAEALARRDWQLDEDEEGATIRFPPGTEPTAAAFEVLAALTLAGAPADVRRVTAVDGRGQAVALGT